MIQFSSFFSGLWYLVRHLFRLMYMDFLTQNFMNPDKNVLIIDSDYCLEEAHLLPTHFCLSPWSLKTFCEECTSWRSGDMLQVCVCEERERRWETVLGLVQHKLPFTENDFLNLASSSSLIQLVWLGCSIPFSDFSHCASLHGFAGANCQEMSGAPLVWNFLLLNK